MKRGKPLKRSRKRPDRAQREAHDRFRVTVKQGPCLWSVTRPGHVCSGPLDPHHVLKEQSVRNHHFLFRMKRLDPERFWSIVHDPRLGVPLCRFNAHALVDNPQRPEHHLFFNELSPQFFEAVAEHQLENLMEKSCRPGSFFDLGVQQSMNSEQEEG